MESMKKAQILLCVVLVALWTVGSVGRAQANLLTDPGLESVDTAPLGWTQDYGVWGGDPAESVGRENTITPFEGKKMLRFLWASISGQATFGISCDVYQLVDVSPFSSLVSSGLAVASASARFNRVAGDSFTDTAFSLQIRSYNDTPDNVVLFLDQTAVAKVPVISDGDPSTWEEVSVTLAIPADTVFLALIIFPEENVLDNFTPPEIEFDGHYADAASLTIDSSTADLCEGDFDKDNDVDGADLAVFAADFGRTDCCRECQGDFDNDNDVDGADLAVFSTDFGRTDCAGNCEGDFDNDNDVDGADLAVFSADFGRTDCCRECQGDFNNDGDVDGADLATFAADFGRTDCP